METEKHNQVWKEFQNKMASLKKRRLDVLSNISKKLDQQKIDKIMKKLKNK